MSDEACGSEGKEKFLSEYDTVSQFMQETLKSVLQATKSSNELPAAGDDWDFYSSFPTFQELITLHGNRVLQTIQSILKHENVKVSLGDVGGATDMEDKLDQLMDANDQILERVGTWLDEASGLKKDDCSLVVATATPKSNINTSWNKKFGTKPGVSSPSFRLLSARNIQRPQLRFKDKVDNSQTPFRPILKQKPNATVSLDESLRLPEGVTPEMAENPEFNYPHPYQREVEGLQYTGAQLSACEVETPPALEETPHTYVSTTQQLDKLLDHLKQQTVIAVDLEHHNYRSFQGFTCLMQLSTYTQDFLVDTLELRSDLQCLNQVFTDPNIVKVLHGADMDIQWLQRDLGLYIVNLFDTGQAARVMNFAGFGLDHLLKQYCGVTANKQYQLADWRIRPLPDDMERYAREDTHYLLYIYGRMKNELISRGNKANNLLTAVLQKSNSICLKVYKKPLCLEDGYLELYKKNKKVFNSRQLHALRELFNWRDETARREDESYGYVLPNHMLLQMCDILPREKQGVLACCNPIPPLVRQYLIQIHAYIEQAREAPLTKVTMVVREQRPTVQQHPKYDVDSLLNCPHDLSHTQHTKDISKKTCLMDSEKAMVSTELDPRINIRITTSLTAFLPLEQEHVLATALEKKVADTKASFSSPYSQYLPDCRPSSILKPSALDNTAQENKVRWRLLPATATKKARRTADTGEPAAKKQRSSEPGDGPPMGPAKHTRYTEDGEQVVEIKPTDATKISLMDDDDQKALPRDLQIPLRFQMPTKKKKAKKNKNRDLDLLDSVQQHIANIRQLQEEESDMALGENPGDEQPFKLPESKKTKFKYSKHSQQASSVSDNIDSTQDSRTVDTSSVRPVKTGDRDSMTDSVDSEVSKSTVQVEIDSDSDDDVRITHEEFKPYDYKGAAQNLLKGTPGSRRDYYKPDGGGRGGKSKGMRNKSQMSSGKRSFTWKSKK